MAYYVDTSFFVKLVVREAHSAASRRWAEAHEEVLFSSDLLRTEALRTARRHSAAALAAARARLDAIAIMAMTPDVFERAAELDRQILRTLDALHLAAALTVGDELEGIATYDDRLAEAAAIHGVPTATPK